MYRLTLHKRNSRNCYTYSIIIKGRSKKIIDKIGYVRRLTINNKTIYIGINKRKFSQWLIQGVDYKRSNFIYSLLLCFLKISK